MDSAARSCGICGVQLASPQEEELHRVRHRVPTGVVAFPGCLHAPLFVDLQSGSVQIAPLVVDTATRRVPRSPWDSDVLPVPVRRVLEVQDLKAPTSKGPHFPRDERSARELDELYHQLGGTKARASPPVQEAEASAEGETDEDLETLIQGDPLEFAIGRARYYRTEPPYGLTDEELIWRVLGEAVDVDEKELRRALFAEGLIDSPHTALERAVKKAGEIRGTAPWLDDEALVGTVLRDFPEMDRDDILRALVESGLAKVPGVHGPFTLTELVRLAAAEGRPWDLVESRLQSLASPEKMRRLRGLFNRVSGLRVIFGEEYRGYWCGTCEQVHYLWSARGRRHQYAEAKHHALEPL